jgi:hypothetical protein
MSITDDKPTSSTEWQAGFDAAKAKASAIARLYENELRQMGVDSLMLTPSRNGDFSEEAQAKSLEMVEEGWRKGEAAQAAENIAAAIEAMS